MAKKKESNLKKVGRFVTDELLGVDDAKRVISKARKGDIKGALKSAATGALELGTTVTGAGIGAKVGAKVAGKKVAQELKKKAAKELVKKVGRDIGGRSGGASNLTNAIQKRSVKVVKANKAAVRLEKNSQAKANADTAKSGAMARYNAGQIEKARQLPAKVVKVNSAAKAKSPDAAKSANAKALKAANKKK